MKSYFLLFPKVTNNEDGRASPPFDIIDGSEPGSRMSYTSDARENVVKLHMAARESEFTEKYPFRYVLFTYPALLIG